MATYTSDSTVIKADSSMRVNAPGTSDASTSIEFFRASSLIDRQFSESSTITRKFSQTSNIP